MHAIQVEINAALLITTPAEELIAQVRRGEIPDKAEANIARIRRCLGEVVAALPAVLTALHPSGRGSSAASDGETNTGLGS